MNFFASSPLPRERNCNDIMRDVVSRHKMGNFNSTLLLNLPMGRELIVLSRVVCGRQSLFRIILIDPQFQATSQTSSSDEANELIKVLFRGCKLF